MIFKSVVESVLIFLFGEEPKIEGRNIDCSEPSKPLEAPRPIISESPVPEPLKENPPLANVSSAVKSVSRLMAQPENLKLKNRIINDFGSQYAFAERVGISRAYLSQIIKRKRRPSPRVRARILAELRGKGKGA